MHGESDHPTVTAKRAYARKWHTAEEEETVEEEESGGDPYALSRGPTNRQLFSRECHSKVETCLFSLLDNCLQEEDM